jgi:cytoskeletal protein CcmA (bactofilin family)
MSETPRRRLTDHLPASPTLIGQGSTLTGNLACRGDLVVAGTIEGDVQVQGSVTLSDSGYWEGDLTAATAIVAGEIVGNLTVTDRLEIRKTAKIRGSIRAKVIAIATGAVIDGEMAVTSNQPVVRFEEKRGG